MHEKASHRAGPGIAVLVRTPGSEVNVPVMQLDGDIAVRMSEIPPDQDPAGMRMLGNLLHIEELAGIILDTGEENKSSVIGVAIDVRDDPFGGNLVFSILRPDQDHRVLRVQIMPRNMGLDSELLRQDHQQPIEKEKKRLT